MKKLFSLAFFVLVGAALWAASSSTTPSNPFQDDLSRLDNEFAGMTQLEQLVETTNSTYTQLAAENNTLLSNVTSDHQDISASLLGAGGEMDKTLKVVLIIVGGVVVVILACCLIWFLAYDSYWWDY